MVLRFLARWLMNDRFIDKLAESYPFRRAAKWTVYLVHKFRAIDIKPEEYIRQDKLKTLGSKLEEKLKNIAEDLQKKSKKH